MINPPTSSTSSSSGSGTSTSGPPQQQTVADLTAAAQLIGQGAYGKDTTLVAAVCQQYVNHIATYQTTLQGLSAQIAGNIPNRGLADYNTAGIINNPNLPDASDVAQKLINKTTDEALPAFDKINDWLTQLLDGMTKTINGIQSGNRTL